MPDNKITITAGDVILEAELNDSETAKQIFASLPLSGQANVWGEEIYFEIPLALTAETDARVDVGVGELGYWPAGKAFCIFFGPTPVSTDDQPRAYSPVNVFGRITGDARQLLAVDAGTVVRVQPA